MATGEAEYRPCRSRDVSIDGQYEGTGARCHSFEVAHEGIDLTPSMSVVDVTLGLGFRDYDPEAGSAAAGDDVGTVTADEGRHCVARSVEEVRSDVHRRMALLYGLCGGDD